MKNVIYCLIEPRINHPRFREVRYVGQTASDLNRRYRKHLDLSRGENNHKANWIRKLKSLGLKPILEIVQIFQNDNYLDEAEQYWISYFESIGCSLVNATSGGKRFVMSEEIKEKIGNANKGRKISESQKEYLSKINKGKVHSEETKQKLRDVYRNLPENVKFKLAHNGGWKKNKGKKRSIEDRIKLSRAHGGKPFKDHLDNIYQTISDASSKLGISGPSIWKVLNGQKQMVRGYTFKYITEPEN